MMYRILTMVAVCATVGSSPGVAQTTLGVQVETAPGSGTFGPQTTFEAFDGDGLTAADYYRRSPAQYRGPLPSFAPPAVRRADLVPEAINVFYVETSEGLALFWIATPSGTGGGLARALHTVSGATFAAPLAVVDGPEDSVKLLAGGATLGTLFTYTNGRTDGFAALLTSSAFTLDTRLVSAASVTASPTWAVHQPGAAPLTFPTEARRALRFAPVSSTVTVADVTDSPGWRLLSAPVRGVTADDLAAQNYVQGVPGADGVPGQYPDVETNLFTGYAGGGRYDYVPAASTAAEIAPGRGFWWYWYDLDFDPPNDIAGGGTSVSVDLDGFSLSATGPQLAGDTTLVYTDNTNSASDSGQPDANPDPVLSGAPAGTVSPADDDFYLVGNPYPRPFAVSAMSATGGTLADAAFIWNPANGSGTPPDDPDPTLDGPGSYEVVFQTPIDGVPDSIAVWQGLLAEVIDPSPVGGEIAFLFDVQGSFGTGDPPFYGRTDPESYVHLSLGGVSADGAPVRDEAAYVRFRPDALTAWDRYDASKPIPPSGTYALVAPVGTRDGEAVRQGVLALPEGSEPTVTLAFTATTAGDYVLRWQGTALDARLADHVTGDVVDLTAATQYAFTAEAGDWTERFSLAFASAVDAEAPLAGALSVGQPTPNPAAGRVQIEVRLDVSGDATLSVYDALGRRVRTVSEALTAGTTRALTVPTAGLAPGAYVVAVEAPGVRETRRLTLLR